MGFNDANNFEMKQKSLNPWFSIWLHPRTTIRNIIDSPNNTYVLELAALGGITTMLEPVDFSEFDSYPAIFYYILSLIVGGIIVGILTLYFLSALVLWTEKLIGGYGSFGDIITAVAWSNVPIIWSLILWIFELLTIGLISYLYTYPNYLLHIMTLIFDFTSLVIVIWSFIIIVNCIAEAQRLSIWRALLSLLSGSVILLILGFSIYF